MIKCELAALVLFVFFAVMPCIGRDDTRVDNILSRTNLPERRFLMACARSDLSADEYSKLLVDLAEGTLSRTNEFETIWHKEVWSSMNMFATTNALPYIERIMASDNEDEQAALMVAYTRLRHFDSCARSVVVRLARRNMQARKIAGKIVERAFLKLSQMQEDEKSRILKADVELLASELGMRVLKNPGLKSVEPKADRRIIHATGTTGCRSINVAPDARKEDR